MEISVHSFTTVNWPEVVIRPEHEKLHGANQFISTRPTSKPVEKTLKRQCVPNTQGNAPVHVNAELKSNNVDMI